MYSSPLWQGCTGLGQVEPTGRLVTDNGSVEEE